MRHGLRFEVTLHTTASWDAFTTHSEYMRRRFDTVIKTDVLYGADEDKIQKAKSDMRREEMWRDRWARIHVPDRTLSESTHKRPFNWLLYTCQLNLCSVLLTLVPSCLRSRWHIAVCTR